MVGYQKAYQSHVLVCFDLTEGLIFVTNETARHEDIFSESLEQQALTTRIFETLFKLILSLR